MKKRMSPLQKPQISQLEGTPHASLWVGPILAGLLLAGLLLTGCAGRMRAQPRYEPLAASTFFDDGAAARPLVPHTVARGLAYTDTLRYTGRMEGAPAELFPFPVTLEVLQRGQERYNIFCSPCHGYDGSGDGMIVRRGLKHPPSFHSDRLRNLPPGYLFNVITNGFGTMYSYGDRIQPDDRWAIVAYIRALQLSQHVSVEELPPEIRQQLLAEPVQSQP
ncbi:MAG: hypothetical protein KatS3mg050_3704 [Litorilinea sp.]|nr:MAG: hypothetical protein KatS3mg050_3704 [Litorilinea sp.]